jgi:hypothetical protein
LVGDQDLLLSWIDVAEEVSELVELFGAITDRKKRFAFSREIASLNGEVAGQRNMLSVGQGSDVV